MNQENYASKWLKILGVFWQTLVLYCNFFLFKFCKFLYKYDYGQQVKQKASIIWIDQMDCYKQPFLQTRKEPQKWYYNVLLWLIWSKYGPLTFIQKFNWTNIWDEHYSKVLPGCISWSLLRFNKVTRNVYQLDYQSNRFLFDYSFVL